MRSPQPSIPKPAKSSAPFESHGRPGYETPAISAGAAVARRARCPRRKLACFCSTPMAGFYSAVDTCQQHPDWCSAGISESEFSDFAKAFGGLTHREAHVFYTKHDFWRARAGVSQYHYGA